MKQIRVAALIEILHRNSYFLSLHQKGMYSILMSALQKFPVESLVRRSPPVTPGGKSHRVSELGLATSYKIITLGNPDPDEPLHNPIKPSLNEIIIWVVVKIMAPFWVP